jgi:aminopeptidase N
MLKTFLLAAFFFIHAITWAQQAVCHLAKASSQGVMTIASPADVAKMNAYDVYFYKLDVAIERTSVFISGNAEIHARVVKDMPEFVIELHDSLSIDSLLINGTEYAYSRDSNRVNVAVNLLQGSTIVAQIFYHGFCPQSTDAAIGSGFSNSLTPHEVTWSLSQPYSAREWWPCKQVLYDKADSSAVWITTDSSNKAGSNGLLVNTTVLPGGKKRYEWKSHYPIDYYLISVAVSDYEEYNLYAHPEGMATPLLIQNYIYDSAVKPLIDITPSSIELYSHLYGLYPFSQEKYGHCQVKLNGAMEHQTMSTMGSFSFNTVVHELAHHWFGDKVTCGSWADIWLNEGFASYSEYVSHEGLSTGLAKQWIDIVMNDAKVAQGSVYVLDTQNVARMFDGYSTYRKGAILLHMLRYEINNDSIFFLGLRNHLQMYAYATALGPDFQTSMEQTAGIDFDFFFDQWYYGQGYPVFSGKWNQIGDHFYLNLLQSSTNATTPLFETHLDMHITFTSGDTSIRIWSDSASRIYDIVIAGKAVTDVELDRDNHVLNDMGTLQKDPLFNAIPDVKGEERMLVYPNPTNDLLYITLAKESRVEVFTITGKKQVEKFMDDNDGTLSLQDLNDGMYFVKVTKGNSSHTVKIMKQ